MSPPRPTAGRILITCPMAPPARSQQFAEGHMNCWKACAPNGATAPGAAPPYPRPSVYRRSVDRAWIALHRCSKAWAHRADLPRHPASLPSPCREFARTSRSPAVGLPRRLRSPPARRARHELRCGAESDRQDSPSCLLESPRRHQSVVWLRRPGEDSEERKRSSPAPWPYSVGTPADSGSHRSGGWPSQTPRELVADRGDARSCQARSRRSRGDFDSRSRLDLCGPPPPQCRRPSGGPRSRPPAGPDWQRRLLPGSDLRGRKHHTCLSCAGSRLDKAPPPQSSELPEWPVTRLPDHLGTAAHWQARSGPRPTRQQKASFAQVPRSAVRSESRPRTDACLREPGPNSNRYPRSPDVRSPEHRPGSETRLGAQRLFVHEPAHPPADAPLRPESCDHARLLPSEAMRFGSGDETPGRCPLAHLPSLDSPRLVRTHLS